MAKARRLAMPVKSKALFGLAARLYNGAVNVHN
jgi:hypothetical protein